MDPLKHLQQVFFVRFWITAVSEAAENCHTKLSRLNVLLLLELLAQVFKELLKALSGLTNFADDLSGVIVSYFRKLGM
jgi:hypothetical protein